MSDYIDWGHYKVDHPQIRGRVEDDEKPPFIIVLTLCTFFAFIITCILCVIAVMLLGMYKLFQFAL